MEDHSLKRQSLDTYIRLRHSLSRTRGKVGYAQGEVSVNTGGTKANLKVGGNLAQGTVTVNQNGVDASVATMKGRVEASSGNTSAIATTDGDIGLGVKISVIKAEIMVNVKAAATWVVETINSFEDLGAFDSLKPTPIGPNAE